MLELRFDEKKCAACKNVDCLTRCRYMDLDVDAARTEWKKVIDGEDTSVLTDCITCCACEEYCPHGNHPFYLKCERMEEKGISPVPRPCTTMMKQGFPLSKPGEFEIAEELKGLDRILDFCIMPVQFMLKGPLFEGLTMVPSDAAATAASGHHYFCQLGDLHFGAMSVVKERLPQVIENVAKYNAKEVICFHDECYGAYTHFAPAYGLEVPFKPVHFFEYLFNRLTELKDRIKPVNMKVAYQRPCSAHYSPQADHWVDDIFNLIGVERVKREYDKENAMCCSSIVMMQKPAGRYELAMSMQKSNIADMKNAGAMGCVFNCPACMGRLGEPALMSGIMPMFMFNICERAIA